MPALIFRIVCKWTYYISLNVLLKVTNWVFPYPYFLRLIISQLLHQNISSIWWFQIILRIHISLCKLSLRVSGVKWNFIVAVRYNVVAFIMSCLWDPFHKLLPRALGWHDRWRGVWDDGDEDWRETDWVNGAHSEMKSPGDIVFSPPLLSSA